MHSQEIAGAELGVRPGDPQYRRIDLTRPVRAKENFGNKPNASSIAFRKPATFAAQGFYFRLPLMQHPDPDKSFRQNISYYDRVAEEYDSMLGREVSNAEARTRVSKAFMELVPSGSVLDFGGGTGLDLGWMCAQGYRVFFCEPSAGMRKKAEEYNHRSIPGGQVKFLSGDETDFMKWAQQRPPFAGNIDGILANFAVLNNIEDLQKLFACLSLLLRPKGWLLACLLEAPKGLMGGRRNWISWIFGRPRSYRINYHGNQQVIYVHPLKETRRACLPYFEFAGKESLHPAPFFLIRLQNK
jgi:SAM-dependent methyltransferase